VFRETASFVEESGAFEGKTPQGVAFEARCLVHGGAWDIPAGLSSAHRKGISRAARAVELALCGGAAPLDALVAGLDVLEDDPVFDAGHGSFLNAQGRVELDAAVMEGQWLLAGAVASLGAFAHPGRIALDVLRHTDHVLLVGEGAGLFAKERGYMPITEMELVHPREREAHEKWIAAGRPHARSFFGSVESGSAAGNDAPARGTVGVVLAVREAGQSRWSLFAGTSTGGTPGKRVGRVGDVPIPGAGLYADDRGACVSATGWGEAFLRMLPAKRVSDLCAGGVDPQEACAIALRETLERTGGRGGLIAISHDGRMGSAHTTPDMAVCAPRPPTALGG